MSLNNEASQILNANSGESSEKPWEKNWVVDDNDSQPLDIDDWINSINSPKPSELSFYEKYGNELLLTGALLSIFLIIYMFVFLAKKYSYVRVMLLISALYLMLIFLPYGLHYEEVLTMSLPIWIFWGFRFIKYGVLGVFKDKK